MVEPRDLDDDDLRPGLNNRDSVGHRRLAPAILSRLVPPAANPMTRAPAANSELGGRRPARRRRTLKGIVRSAHQEASSTEIGPNPAILHARVAVTVT
jgi:hypothetical protein